MLVGSRPSARRAFAALAFVLVVGGGATTGCGKRGASGDEPALGRVVCWGAGRSGQIGNGKNEDDNRPSSVAGVDAASKLSLGSSSSCARVAAGLHCWGDVQDGAPSNAPRPFTLVPDAEVVQTSVLFGCALRKTGEVACWGGNLVGQLGNGKAPDPGTAVKLKVADGNVALAEPLPAGAASEQAVAVTGLTDAIALAVGGSHACALRRDGSVVCWGSNTVGQLGDGRSGYSETSDHPVAVAGVTGAVGISTGNRVSCARTQDAVWCWGSLSEQYPQDGAQPVVQPVPTRIAGIVSPVEVAVTETEACARSATGEVHCWRADGKAERMTLEPVAQLTAGTKHLCARLVSGAVTCWGSNDAGQLGVEIGASGGKPVPGVKDVVDVAAGGGHTCVIRKPA